MLSERILQEKFDKILEEVKDLLKDFPMSQNDLYTLAKRNRKLSVSPHRISIEFLFPREEVTG